MVRFGLLSTIRHIFSKYYTHKLCPNYKIQIGNTTVKTLQHDTKVEQLYNHHTLPTVKLRTTTV